MASTIKTKLTLDGVEQVKAQLQQLGTAGSAALKQIQDAATAANFEPLAKAFDQIKVAGDRFSTGLAKIRQDLSPLGDGLKKAGDIAGISLAGGIIGAVTALVFLSKGAVDNIKQQSDLAKAVGLSADQLGALGLAAKDAGLQTDQLVSALSRFARASNQNGKQQLTDLIGLAKDVAQSFKGAGVVLPQFFEPVDQLMAKLVPLAKQVQAQLAQSLGSFSPSVNQIVQGWLAVLQRGGVAADELREKLNKVGASLKPADVFSALDEQLKLSTGDLSRFVNLLDEKGNLVGTREALARFADFIATLPDGIQKTALAAQFLGREVGPLLVPQLNKGRAGLDDLDKEFQRLGLSLSDADKKAAELAQKSFLDLDAQSRRLKNSLGIVFAPVLATAANAFASAINNNISTVRTFAELVAARIMPVVRDLIALLSGRNEDIQSQWIIDWRNAIMNFGQTLLHTYNDVIVPSFNKIMDVLGKVAKSINSLFGTNLSGKDLGIGLIIGQVTGVNNAVLDVIKTVGILAIAFRGLLGPIALVAAGFAAWNHSADDALKNIQQHEQDAKVDSLGIGAAVAQGFSTALETIQGVLAQIAQGIASLAQSAWQSVATAAENAWNQIFGSFNSLADRIKGIINTLAAAWLEAFRLAPGVEAGAGGAGFATGGLFRGKPGKDTNLAWLTDYEFVMRPEAVRKYGVGFLAALNSMKLPLDQLRGFSVGGLVDGLSRSLAVPTFATGGLNLAPAMASRGRPITLVLDGRSFGGLSASDDAAESLIRYARKRGLASAGRAPSRIR